MGNGASSVQAVIHGSNVELLHQLSTGLETENAFENITRSMGFLVNNGMTMLPPAKAYQWALDSAVIKMESGAFSYTQAITAAVKELAAGGLKTVEYESGHVDSIDVAVRRAVLTGVNQLNQKYREQSMDFLKTDLVEVTAHSGARDIDGPKGWENHKKWQGRIYRWHRADSAGHSPEGSVSPKNHVDITEQWRAQATPGSHEVKDLQSYTANGVTYTVDGRNVVLDYSAHEKEIAELLEREFGGEIYMVPRVNNPQGVSTPDYLFRGTRFDLKSLQGGGKNTFYNAVAKKAAQAENFIFDLSACPLSDDEVSRQIALLFSSAHTKFIDTIVLVKNGDIICVMKRKR